MKILVVTSTFQKTENDTVTDFVFNWLKTFQKKGHEVKVIAAHYPGLPEQDNLHGIPVERFKYWIPESQEQLAYGHGIIDNMRASHLAKLQMPSYLLSGSMRINKVINDFKPDIVHALWAFPNGWMAALVRKFRKFPLVISVIGSEAYLAKKFKAPWIVSFPCNTADMLASVSSTSISAAKECGAKKPFNLVFNGVDTDIFKPKNIKSKEAAAVRKEFNLKPKDKMILCIGRFVERKGQKYVIEAMPKVIKKLPNTKLVLLGGGGPDEHALKEFTKKNKLEKNIIFAGKRGHDTLRYYYAASDLFIIPSVTDSSGVAEGGQGLVTKEAMCTGIPVIGTNNGGIPDIIFHEKTGLLVKEKNSDEMADAIIRILSDEKLANNLAKEGYKIAMEKAAWTAIVSTYEKLYSKLLK